MQSQKIIEIIDINHYMIDEEIFNLVIPGDLITQDQGYMNGHGTYKIDNYIYASQVGTVQITNKLIIVNPLKNKYTPQIGDIVVGKIVEISNKRWKIDINSSAFASLNLNSTYIPQQRKKNQQDQFNMRKIMQENDIIVAQVHSINPDRTCNLHTRNPKYGKLQAGVLIQVQHKQIKRQKYHMISIGNVGIILGNNGSIWLSLYKRNNLQQQQKQANNYQMLNIIEIAKLHNIIKLIGWQGLQISQFLLKQILQFVQQKNIQADQILDIEGEVKKYLLQGVRDRVPNRIQQQFQKIKNK